MRRQKGKEEKREKHNKSCKWLLDEQKKQKLFKREDTKKMTGKWSVRKREREREREREEKGEKRRGMFLMETKRKS